jgi:hypothetical protein
MSYMRRRGFLLVIFRGGWWLTVRQLRADVLEMDKRLIFKKMPVKTLQVLALD